MLNKIQERLVFLVIASFILQFRSESLQGQQIPFCAFESLHTALLESNLIYKQEVEQLNKNIYEIQLNKAQAFVKPNYTLPVVVHIVSPPGTGIGSGNNLSDEQVEYGLQLLNDAFANKGSFYSVDGIETGIQFCLAKRDPQGNPTNGITRDYSNLVNDNMCSPGTNSSLDGMIKALVNWDCRRYINIWLVTDLFNGGFGCSLAGYAYFPGAPCAVDGIVQESRYWNSVGGTRVTAHEFGHYFSLHHTFNGACANADCLLDGDQVCDTPPDNSPAFASCNTNSCSTDIPDLADDNTNYMDYSSCNPPHFTQGQANRMIAALESARIGLINSNGCLPVANLDANLISLNADDAICGDSLCLNIEFRNDGIRDINQLVIELKANNVLLVSLPWTGVLKNQERVRINFPCVYLDKGTYTIQVGLNGINNGIDEYLFNNILEKQISVYEKLILQIDSVNPTRCISDGALKVSCTGGTPPYNYSISSKAFPQTSSWFNLLLNGNHEVFVADSSGCKDTAQVFIPDSCKSFSNKKFITNRDARHLGNDCYLLTPEDFGKAGSVWYEDKINLLQDFEVNFQMNLGCLDRQGADGIAFVLQPISTSIGSAGGGIGYEGILPSLAVEFDTWENSENGDPAYDHAAIIRNGNIDHRRADNLAGPVPIITGFGNAEDCNFHNVIISWDSKRQNLKVYFDCLIILDYTSDVIKRIFDSDPEVYFGFTAATGGAINTQQICLNYVSFLDKLQDKQICKGEAIQISGNPKFKDFNWSPKEFIQRDNSVNPVFNPDTTTQYFVEFKDNCGRLYKDSFIIYVISPKLKYSLELSDSCMPSGTAKLEILPDAINPGIRYSLNGFRFDTQKVYILNRPGAYTIFAEYGNCIISEVILLNRPIAPLRDSLIFVQARTCKDSGIIHIQAMNGYPPYRYILNGGSAQNEGYFKGLLPGNYTLEILDSKNCSISRNVLIDDYQATINLNIDSSNFDITCCKTKAFVHLTASGSSPLYYYQLNNGRYVASSNFDNLLPGTHRIVARDELSCVSDTLIIQVKDFTGTDRDTFYHIICEGSSIKVGNSIYTKSGLYQDIYSNQYCCDSIVTTDLTVNAIFDQLINTSICMGDSFRIGNTSYVSSGKYIDTLFTKNNCDSVIQLELTVNPVYLKIDSVRFCSGGQWEVGQNTYSKAGFYIDTLKTVKDCDSIINTWIDIWPVYSKDYHVEICDGDWWEVGNKKYLQSGNYIDTLNTSFGCDSLIQSQLTVWPTFSRQFSFQKCPGDSIVIGNNVYYAAGQYIDTLGSIHSCDSIIQTSLFIDTISIQLQLDSIYCFGIDDGQLQVDVVNGVWPYVIEWNGKSFQTQSRTFRDLPPGQYPLSIKDSLGCSLDTVIFLFQPQENLIDLTAEIEIKLGEVVQLIPQFNFIAKEISWTPSSGLSCDDCPNPIVKALRSQEFSVFAKDKYGCETYARVFVKVDNNVGIYIPNVFSPNGDQINDKLRIIGGPGIERVLLFQIFDRWGEQVYSAENFMLNDPDFGWDGLFRNQVLDPGVFVYFVRAMRIDGSLVEIKGNVTLLK